MRFFQVVLKSINTILRSRTWAVTLGMLSSLSGLGAIVFKDKIERKIEEKIDFEKINDFLKKL